ncbi:trans-sulfuration enzyme family protein [Lutibaculum baratangense]|uniref:Cystathionine gamma-lyase n=1 Tax=Lutibaculum baratangense AMV1 TaxID=631454 RepID=V4RC10_9HYPH|nr:PLP-dependent aspartate aminotransferase family protein [Lutibaculum baratangense]ESR23701.1 Cystathionine gamma-lyase [Lutibaculum baratangense AMV1]
MGSEHKRSPETIAAQGLHAVDPATGAVVPPLHPATTFARGGDYELLGAHFYSRYGSPTVDQAERAIAALEGGIEAQLFGSGLAAFTALVESVPEGAAVVAPRTMYFGGQDWLRRLDARGRIRLALFDETDDAALEAACAEARPELVCIETPANPTWSITDIAAAAETAHRHGARLAVDSTGAPPPTTRPLELGADIVFHSATKYLNGHSDVTAGVLVAREDGERWQEIRQVRMLTGALLGPFEAWLLLRGLRTLYVRFARQSETAMALATALLDHPKVERVLYPGLDSHPRHSVARRQMTGGFGGMLSILVAGGAAEGRAVAAATELFVPATSLGGVESLIEHRRSIESPQSAVADNLIRLSVGLEAVDDLLADLRQALERI